MVYTRDNCFAEACAANFERCQPNDPPTAGVFFQIVAAGGPITATAVLVNLLFTPLPHTRLWIPLLELNLE